MANLLPQTEVLMQLVAWVKSLFVQPDYAQNDSQQPDFIKNRTHYVENVSTSSVWNQSGCSVGSGSSSPGGYPATFNITTGNKYNVTISQGNNSKTYEGLTAEYDSVFNGLALRKNWSDSMGMSDTSTDALLLVVQPSNVVLRSADIYGENCTVQVSEVTETIHKLDPKYLPDNVNQLDSITTSKSGKVTTITFEQTNGTETQFQVTDGEDGTNGKSAYQVAVDNGYSGTEAQWLASLKGADGVSLGEVELVQQLSQDDDKVPSAKAVQDGIEVWRDDIEYIYKANDLTFDGTNYVDTGWNPYNPEGDFYIKMEISDLNLSGMVASGIIIGCIKQVNPYPGFVIRKADSNNTTINVWLDGASRWPTTVNTGTGSKNIIIFKRVGNVYTFQVNGGTINTFTSTANNTNALNLYIGSGLNANNNLWRFGKFHLDLLEIKSLEQSTQLYSDYTKDIKIYPKTKADDIEGLDAAIWEGNKNTVVISPDCVVRGTSTPLTSVDKYKFDELNTIEVVFKGVPSTASLNWYNSDTLCEIRKNSNTYIRWYIQGYKCTASIVIDGTTYLNEVVATNIGSGTPRLNQYVNYAATIDLYQKAMRIIGADIEDGSIVVIYEVDISNVDISSFEGSEVNINSHIYGYWTDYYCIYVRVNCYDEIGGQLNTKFYSGHYNVFPTYNLESKLGYDEYITGLSLGGTITETISATHKKCSATNQSGYFRISPTVSLADAVAPDHLSWSVKFKLLSGNITITSGVSGTVYIRDTNGNKVTTIEQGVEYILYVREGDNILSYSLNYGVKASGTFELEVWEPKLFFPQSQIICAETWNGLMFTGAIPYSAAPNFKQIVTKNAGTGSAWYPIGELRLSGTNIQMFNGTTWKQINNS